MRLVILGWIVIPGVFVGAWDKASGHTWASSVAVGAVFSLAGLIFATLLVDDWR